MKNTTRSLLAALATAGLVSLASAVETPPAPPGGAMAGMDHSGGGMNQPMGGMGGMMGGGMGGMSDAQMDEHIRKWQDNQLKVHELSHKIMEAKDEKEKEKLKEEQFKLIKEHHQAMRAQMKDHMQMMMQHRGGMKPDGAPGGGMMPHGTPPTQPPAAP